MKQIFFSILLCSTVTFGQNSGINTKTPASTLTVNGSFAANYRIVTEYKTILEASDYYIAYNGNTPGVILLPTAISGPGNFKGRVYCIKNTSAFPLQVYAGGGELIDGSSDVSFIELLPGYYVELISKGTVTQTTWELSVFVATTSASTMTKLVDIALATPQGSLASSTLNISNLVYSVIPDTKRRFILPVSRTVFLNFSIGIDNLDAYSSIPPYFRCELFINNNPTGLFQIVQQQAYSHPMQFNISGVRGLAAGIYDIDVRIIRWYNNGAVYGANQNFGILSLILSVLYMD